MTCHRRYTFTFTGGNAHQQVLHGLLEACEQHWWFGNPEVRGAGLGVMQVQFEVSARDQWWAHRRAMDLMERTAWPTPVPVPTWEVLAPHTNRGRYRVAR